jgi:DNA-binding MarR family transcriptional regulator
MPRAGSCVPSNVTGLVDRLHAHGLLERRAGKATAG